MGRIVQPGGHGTGKTGNLVINFSRQENTGNLGTTQGILQISLIMKYFIVYRKGDIVKQPMEKGSFVPKNVPGVGWGRLGWGGVGHVGVGWGMVGHEGWVMSRGKFLKL